MQVHAREIALMCHGTVVFLIDNTDVCCFSSSSSSSAFPAISLEFTILGEIFAYGTVF